LDAVIEELLQADRIRNPNPIVKLLGAVVEESRPMDPIVQLLNAEAESVRNPNAIVQLLNTAVEDRRPVDPIVQLLNAEADIVRNPNAIVQLLNAVVEERRPADPHEVVPYVPVLADPVLDAIASELGRPIVVDGVTYVSTEGMQR
jgi:hypothetical protein